MSNPNPAYKFPKGVSANPGGRPKGKMLSTLLFEALKERARKEDGTLSEKTHADLVVSRLLQDNIKYGKRTELIFDRIEGQAEQFIDHTTNGESINQASDDVMELVKKVSAELKARKTKSA